MSVLEKLRRKIRSFLFFRKKQHISTNFSAIIKLAFKTTTLIIIERDVE